MTFDWDIVQTAEKDHHIVDAFYRMHKYSLISTSEDDLIPHSVVSTTIKPLQEITSNHINLSGYSITSSPTSNWPFSKMPPHGAINFPYVDSNLNKCSGRAITARHHHSCPYLDKEDMELISEDNDQVNKKDYK